MELFPIRYKGGLSVLVARFPASKYQAWVKTVQQLHALHDATNGRTWLLLRRKGVKETLAWCLDCFRIQNYCPQSDWRWLVDNAAAINTLFFRETESGMRGTLVEFALKSPDLPEGLPSVIASSGDPMVDVMSGLVVMDGLKGAIAAVDHFDLQSITRLQFRVGEIRNPKDRTQEIGAKKIEEKGRTAEMQRNQLAAQVRLRKMFEKRQQDGLPYDARPETAFPVESKNFVAGGDEFE